MPSATGHHPAAPRRARLFRNGRNQALRIPREFEFGADEVLVYREQNGLMLVPVDKRPALADVLSRLEPLEDGFPTIADPVTTPEDPL